ncbi:uncharacterized protein LOC119839760 [Zerene cesonia]|uniref:uncharacterized protein LOC119839760 n=1 Tax=Zerene cesonia TaxID=33412 RepID=UPI0018E59C3E|nr:uncharacterized protein LOC119839760 [Zerene cesonia]
MLIGRVSEGKETKGIGEDGDRRNSYHEYETANELYDIMADNPRYHASSETLTASDLVILYKNLDIGTKLMTEAKYSQTKPSNQYVETVIYNDDQDTDDSDIGEIYSTEDIRNIMMINKERIDLINNTSSYETNLCQKYGNIAMKPANLTSSYNKHFLFKDPFIKDQLNSFIPENYNSNIFPTSLLDYICCKRLEDNYNFYMDSVITYVQHTIEHLKRISNGDYLTDKAKKKWREVVDPVCKGQDDNKNVLANSISIPLKVNPKLSGLKIMWEDTVHSEVDVRSFSKLLEKRIVVEIPKLICGTYKLFSKQYNDNLIIHCKKESKSVNHDTQSRVDVVLKLKKSDSGHIISKLDSIMILQTVPQTSIQDCITSEPLSIMYNTPDHNKEDSSKIMELNEDDEGTKETVYESSIFTNKSQETFEDSLIGTDTDISSSISPQRRNIDFTDTFILPDKNVIDSKTYNDEQTEANFCITSPNELYCTLQRLTMNSPVPEESEIPIKKKKSASKVRIKSPYENASRAMEEKKRKRLLEIRERRENKKKALSENCKISKHKYFKGAVMARASSSVTKLSITNKSFYNSIYGQAINNEVKNKRKLNNEDLKIIVELENSNEKSQTKSPKLNKSKDKIIYINHSYYLDDADTEVMRLQMKQMSETDNTAECTAATSVASDDFSSNLNLLKDLISPTLSNNHPIEKNVPSQCFNHNEEIVNINMETTQCESRRSITNIVPTNTPKEINFKGNEELQKHQQLCAPTVECRKSIDKIYDLIQKPGKIETLQLDPVKKLEPSMEISDGEDKYEKRYHCSIQASDSGTSVKHHLTSSIPSCFSFERTNKDQQIKKSVIKKSEIPVSVQPKVLIDSKHQVTQSNDNKSKRDRRKLNSPMNKIAENPLKAISQLLHEFENVQKSRLKNDPKPNKKLDSEQKNSSRQVTFKRPLHQEQHPKNNETISRVSTPKERKSRHNTIAQTSKVPNIKTSIDEKPGEKLNRRKVADILDEVKEARGEAVRGPPKTHTRLDSLAQPKKSYIQAHNEQYQNRNMRNTLNKQQKVTNNTVIDRREAFNVRQKRRLELSQKPHSAVPPLGSRRSSSSSPDGNHKRSPLPATGPSHKPNIPEAPKTLIKKMVAVESYVNNHYGRSSQLRDLKDFIGAQKSRVPLIPTDLDIGSVTSSRTAEESTTLGKKLHYMIDTMINTTLPALTCLNEQKETSRSKDDLNEAFVENMDQYEELTSNTEFPIDIFGDKSIATAVASLPTDNNHNATYRNSNIDFITYDIQPFNSTTELQRLENALYRRLSAATFQKRLRIKNLTLTPKHSLQQVFVLHSGDAGSIVVKSTLSQNFTKPKSKTKTELYTPTHSKSLIDWTFANFPKQFATVGYAVPSIYKLDTSNKTTDSVEAKSDSQHSKENRSISSDIKSNKTDQCFYETPTLLEKDEGAQVNETDATEKNTFQDKRNVRLEGSSRNVTKTSKILQEEFNESRLSLISNKIDTTSLDILVGLLNEIKNITSCQTNITKNEHINDDECKELEFILKNAKLQEYSVDHSPQNSLSFDSLKDVREKCNLCALLPSSNLANYRSLINSIPRRSDKEVNVSISGIEYVHTFTEVPSRFFPITVHHSTNVTGSVIGVISEPSEQSLYSFSDYQAHDCNSINRIIELPDIQSKPTTNKTEENAKQFEKHENFIIQCESSEEKSPRNKEVINDHLEFDPMIKMKRDILVTVYSILVMTVFAALSFPEILYSS